MQVNREEIIWAAGFFDGEGHFGFRSTPWNTKMLVLSIAQIDRRVLDRFREAVFGLGKIYGPYKHGRKNESPYWLFSSNRFEPTQAIVAALYQFLSPVKQEQIRTTL